MPLIEALRQQTLAAEEFEVLVVDDGSAVPVNIPGVRVLRQTNQGPASARNLGAAQARGKYLVFTDDDCRPQSGWLAAFTRAIAGQPDVVLAGVTQNACPGNAPAEFNQQLVDYLTAALRDTPQSFATSNNLCVAAQTYRALGGFSQEFSEAAGEDRDFCQRAREAGHPLVIVPDAVVDHAHPQTLWQFVRMHARYGRGARQLPPKPGLDRQALLSWGFARHFWLFLLSQIAVTLGYFTAELRRVAEFVVFSMMSAAVLLGLMFYLGAFTAEFGGADEAAHLVSGIMVYQYLEVGLWNAMDPRRFAEDYYAHYPKVAIGHWPPVFYLLQGLWYQVAGLSRFSVLLLAAWIGGAFAATGALLARVSGVSRLNALALLLAITLLPQTIRSAVEFSSDPLTALLALLAAWACHNWVKTTSLGKGLIFAGLATLGALTKGNAFPVWLLPGVLLLRSRPWAVLRQAACWFPLLLMTLVTAAWYLSFREITQEEVVPGKVVSLSSRLLYSLERNGWEFVSLVSPVGLTGMVFAGLRQSGRNWLKQNLTLALLPWAFLFFLSFLSPHTEARLMLATAPVLLLMLLPACGDWRPWAPAVLLAVCVWWTHWLTPLSPKPQQGYREAAAWLAAQPPATALAAANEGALIAELALLEPAAKHRILRATKLLQSSNWMGGNLQLLVHSAEDVRAVFTRHTIRYVVQDDAETRQRLAAGGLLVEALRGAPVRQTFQNLQISEPIHP